MVCRNTSSGSQSADSQDVSGDRTSCREAAARSHRLPGGRQIEVGPVAISDGARSCAISTGVQEMSFADRIPPHIRRIPVHKSENPAEEIERELGVTVVQLGMNENPFGPSPKAVEAG